MEISQLKKVFELIKLISQVTESKEGNILLENYSRYDLSKLECNIDDNSTLDDIKSFFQNLIEVIDLQQKIIDDAHKKK